MFCGYTIETEYFDRVFGHTLFLTININYNFCPNKLLICYLLIFIR